MGSFSPISGVLASDQSFLADADTAIYRLHQSLDLAIRGEILDAAGARTATALAHVRSVGRTLKSAEDAIEEYQDTVDEIKRKANAAEQQLAEASIVLSKTYIDSPTSPPSRDELDSRERMYAAAQSEHDDATATLNKMAQLRQAADDKLIAAIGDRAYDLVDVELLVRYPTDRRDQHHTETYAYHYSDKVADAEDFSPEEAMKIFQENPGDIFPFDIEGATSFVDGDTIRLLDATMQPLPDWLVDDDGWVRVSTTPTSVTFTVISNDYFDGQGSTITFQTVERNGQIYLEQVADAHDANVLVKAGIDLGGAMDTWSIQADNFRDVLEKSRKP